MGTIYRKIVCFQNINFYGYVSNQEHTVVVDHKIELGFRFFKINLENLI